MIAANNRLDLGPGLRIDREVTGDISIRHPDNLNGFTLSEDAAIKLAEFILYGKNNPTITFDVDGVPMTAVVLQGAYAEHQRARVAKTEQPS